jgi:TPR repeat protein
MTRLLLIIMTAMMLSVGTAWAGPVEDGRAAEAHGDLEAAAKWFRLAAEEGNVGAQEKLGSMYVDGRGVPRDYNEALKWYRLAVVQGGQYAAQYLGYMYSGGLGVPQDYVRAHMWFNLGARSGNAASVAARASLEQKMSPQQIAEAQKMARECQQRNFKDCD